MYLLGFESGILIDTLIRMFKVCNYEIPLYPSYNENDKDSIGAVLREYLIANLKVLINLTHDSNQISMCLNYLLIFVSFVQIISYYFLYFCFISSWL